ncbi:MAG: SRPBCC domain-containing protein [Rubrivivax sp.]|nr:SRPBCC domain-containing protein [Rubrivivax sp.]
MIDDANRTPGATGTMVAPAPVVHSVFVPLAPQEAFDLFTGHMRLWWPFTGHSCGGEDALDVQFEPRPAGAVTELGRKGQRWTWGTLTHWDPPRSFAMRWHPGLPAAEATQLRVTFTPEESGTKVLVHHDGWEARGAAADLKRDQYDEGWPFTLAAFTAAALARTTP